MKKIGIFGKASRGIFEIAHLCKDVQDLFFLLECAKTPEENHAISFAIQSLEHHYEVFFFRLSEEGQELAPYMKGIKFLEQQQEEVAGIFTPGVSSKKIIYPLLDICHSHSWIFILPAGDLYDVIPPK